MVLTYRLTQGAPSTFQGVNDAIVRRRGPPDIVPTNIMANDVVSRSADSATRSRRGQTLVEFGLLLPLIMLIMMGIIQFGLMLSAHVGATNVAREVARYGSVCIVKDSATANSCGSSTSPGALGYLNQILPLRVNAASVATDKTTVTYCSYLAPKAVSTDPDRWNIRITVALGIRYPLFLPLISNLIDGLDGEPGDARFLLLAREAMRVEGSGLATDPNPGVATCT